MKLSSEKYDIEICFDDTYTPRSADNINAYDKVLDLFDITGREKYFKVLDISVSDKRGGKTHIALVCGYMTYSDNCIIKDSCLVIMSENHLISLDLDRAEISSVKSLDIDGSTFEIFPYEDDFIIYGEMEIARVSGKFELMWSFSGADIFITADGLSAFEMNGGGMTVRDFSGNVYRIGYDGREILNME